MAMRGSTATQHEAGAGQRASADRWLAVLAGRAVWDDRDRLIRLPEQVLSGVQAGTLAITATVLAERWFGHDHRYPPTFELLVVPLLVLSTAVAMLGPLRRALRKQTTTRAFWPMVLLRSTIGLVITLLAYAIAPGFEVLYAWPLGVAVGIDLAFGARAIGWQPSLRQTWWALIISPLHLGVLGGLVGTVAIGPETDLATAAITVYLTLHFGVANAAVWAWAATKVLIAQDARLDQLRLATIASERRRSAHWLHDDLCANLRLVTLQVQQRRVTLDETVRLLDDLDHSLRLRQLDELIASGTVRLADVLQPFVRNAQSQGATVDHVPDYRVATTPLDRHSADRVRRALAVFTSNALNAGARHIGFDMELDEHDITVVVTDDAGGFDLSDLHVGRGLWNLREELGHDCVTVERFGSGSHVTARVARDVEEAEEDHHGQPAHR